MNNEIVVESGYVTLSGGGSRMDESMDSAYHKVYDLDNEENAGLIAMCRLLAVVFDQLNR